jgi:hypothetical protein
VLVHGGIGQIGAGKQTPTGQLDVAMIQSLVRVGRVDDLVAGYGHVIVDECHHIPAASFERVLSEVKARFVTGLTATPRRRDGLHPITEMQLGPVRFAVDARSQAARQSFDHRLIVRQWTVSRRSTPHWRLTSSAIASFWVTSRPPWRKAGLRFSSPSGRIILKLSPRSFAAPRGISSSCVEA